jgi:tetratricopeptide (TPR) repeat protein
MKVLVLFLLVASVAAGQAGSDLVSVMSKGQKLVADGELAKAQKLYEGALRSFPDNADLHFELGMVYLRQRNWAKAIDSYNHSLSVSPKRIKTLFYLAEAYFMQADLERARETIAQAASIAPNDAQVCQKYGQYLSAKLETRHEGLLQLQRARRLDANLEHIDFEIGKTQFELTDFQSASGSFETALKKEPGDGQAAFFLAETNARLGDWERARHYYDYALDHNYVDGATYYGKGRALVELADFESALPPLQRALAMEPSLIQAHFQLSKVYRQLGRMSDAGREAKLFAAMNDRIDTSRELKGPEEENAWKHVQPLLEQGNEQQALKYLAELPGSDSSSHGNSYFLLGVIYFSMGRKEDAKRVLVTAEGLSPNDSRVAAYLGMAQLASGEIDAAEQSFRCALGLDASDPVALIGIGGLRYQQERWADAVTYLEKSRTADPDTLFLLCDAYYRVGKPDEARLTAEVIRALGADRKPLLDEVEKLVRLHQTDRPHPVP